MALALLCLLIWALWATQAQRVEYRELSAVVLELSGKDTLYTAKARLPDDNEIILVLSPRPPLPKVGDHIPVIFERYDDGTTRFAFNNTQWIMDAGAAR